MLKRKGLHPKGLLVDQRKSGRLRQFLSDRKEKKGI
jgi:hypothetical protein